MSLIQYLIIMPMAIAFLILLIGKKSELLCGLLAALGSFFLLSMSIFLVPAVLRNGVMVYNTVRYMPAAGIVMAIDAVSAFMLVTANLVAFLVSVYAASYIKKYTDEWKFSSLFMMMVAGINGVLVTSDIFSMYVFMEITAVSAYFLVAFGTSAEEFEAAFKYAIMGVVASAFILLGIAFLYGYASTLNFAGISAAVSHRPDARIINFISVIFLSGFALKAALVPFHAWLPYAHSSAPSPVSALLSGVLIKVLGIYAIVRVFFCVFGMASGVSIILISLGIISMLTGALLAFGQCDIKRLFAYSSISQIGYAALAFGVGTPLSIAAGLFHIFNHSVSKSLLFLDSGIIENISGTRDMKQISELAKREPVTGYTTLAGALSISGMPPFGGFWAKLMIIVACVQAGRPMLAFLSVLVGVLTLAYYFRAITPMLFRPSEARSPVIRKKIPFSMALPVLALAVISASSACLLLPNAGHILLNKAVEAIQNNSYYLLAVSGGM